MRQFGRALRPSVYDLLDYPEVPAANFLLVHRDASGRRTVLAIGNLKHSSPSLNLAEIAMRRTPRSNEVHLHLLAPSSAQERHIIELDLRAGRIGCDSNERIVCNAPLKLPAPTPTRLPLPPNAPVPQAAARFSFRQPMQLRCGPAE